MFVEKVKLKPPQYVMSTTTELIKTLFELESKRAIAYNRFSGGFKSYLENDDEPQYVELCKQITVEFSGLSLQVNEVESKFKSLERSDLAQIVRNIQIQEKQKLENTIKHQMLQKQMNFQKKSKQNRRTKQESHENINHHDHGHHHQNPALQNNNEIEKRAEEEEQFETFEEQQKAIDDQQQLKEYAKTINSTINQINELLNELRFELEDQS